MIGELLLDFDCQLSNYVLHNVRRHLGEPEFAAYAKHWLDPLLWDYITGDTDPEQAQEWLQLNRRELENLMDTFQCPPILQDRQWSADPFLHRRYVDSLLDVREGLAKQVADDWARECADYGKRLQAKRLWLSHGIDIVTDWLARLRHLLRAMGATEFLPRPEGQSPTPTTLADAKPTTTTVSPTQWAHARPDVVERMRKLLRGCPDLRTGKPAHLIRRAKINPQVGRDALRHLKELGEYQGFARDRPHCFQNGRPNER